MTPAYELKWVQEAGWAVLIAVAVQVLTALVALDPNTVTDWRSWGVSLAGASARVAGAVVLNELRKRTPA